MAEVQTTTNTVPFDDILKTLTNTVESQEAKKNDFFEMSNKPLDIVQTLTEKPELEKPEIEEEKEEVIPDDNLTDDDLAGKDAGEVINQIVQTSAKPTKGTEVSLDGDSINKFYMELIKDELLDGFDDDKPVNSFDEIKILIQENIKSAKQQAINEELPQFIESLPEDVQVIVKYASEGGKDLKGMYKALAEVEEFRQVEVKEGDVRAQEDIAFKYLKATGYAKGDDSEIRELIEEMKDNNTLFKRSKRYKSELDEMHEKLVSQKLQEQEQKAKFEEQRSLKQKEMVYDSIIKDNNLNGIKVDKATQNKIFAGLTQKAWDSEDGRKVDMLDALIEYYKVKQPNFKLLGEALYLLLEPETYKKKLALEQKQQVNSENLRTIRTEQSRRATGSAPEVKTGIKRVPNNNFWGK